LNARRLCHATPPGEGNNTAKKVSFSISISNFSRREDQMAVHVKYGRMKKWSRVTQQFFFSVFGVTL
jgi:hypothetical protein